MRVTARSCPKIVCSELRSRVFGAGTRTGHLRLGRDELLRGLCTPAKTSGGGLFRVRTTRECPLPCNRLGRLLKLQQNLHQDFPGLNAILLADNR